MLKILLLVLTMFFSWILIRIFRIRIFADPDPDSGKEVRSGSGQKDTDLKHCAYHNPPPPPPPPYFWAPNVKISPLQIVEDFTETVKRDRLVLANYAREQASQTRYTRTLEDRAREQARQTRYTRTLEDRAREQARQTRYTRTLEDRARAQARQTRYLGRL